LLERIDPLHTDDDLTGGSGFGGALVGAIGSRHFLLRKAWMQGSGDMFTSQRFMGFVHGGLWTSGEGI